MYHEYKSCIRVCFPMSFSLVLMGSSHRLLSVTSPRSHPLLPPPRRSPCATLTVTQFLASVAGTTAHMSPHQIPPPISNAIFLYSLYISALVVFFNDCLRAVPVSHLIPRGLLDRAADSSVPSAGFCRSVSVSGPPVSLRMFVKPLFVNFSNDLYLSQPVLLLFLGLFRWIMYECISNSMSSSSNFFRKT